MQLPSRLLLSDVPRFYLYLLLVFLWLDMSHATTLEGDDDNDNDDSNSSFMESALWTWIGSITEHYGAWTMALAVVISDSIPMLPTQPIAIVAGAVFGIRVGLPAVMAGQALATLFAILVGRYVLARRRRRNGYRRTTEESSSCTSDEEEHEEPNRNNNTKLSRLLAELTVGLNSDDWKILFGTVILARQSPILPFSLGNYFIGASTNAPIVPVVVATIIGCLPLNVLWVGAGAGGTAAVHLAMQEQQRGGWLAMEIVGVVATTAIVGFCLRVMYRVWKEEEDCGNDDDDDANAIETLCTGDRERHIGVVDDDEGPLVSPGF